ncbi:mitochondrial integral membrane protein [Talaromyces proteolyticus]|uniref:Mitochondrial integral membrane protein n=1 Tax=Talaromyces proteolyticus TaxID=1131652 RepID=A0AAD4KTR2_9EURO|nr:mitochondrial integral membrane protein [Talaromyces proteolyticus]KAH8700678.1 mitochondrial integral membrane protein [Talaromyces proteolyticus]
MVSFKPQNDEAGRAEEAEHHGESSTRREPDENTRLLPHGSSEGYLSPDDPAVSPYNLWSVRALRFFSSLFLAISFVWWVLLLISIFVSPPGMHNRGSGFTDFSYTTLTVGNLIISLLFFAVPSRPMIIWNGILALLLLVDVLIIVAVPRLRFEEGGVGIASVVWAALITIYNVAQIYFVEKGKEQEEERLTGRVETRRTLLEWLAVLAETVVLGIVAIVVILLTATLILRARDASIEAPGKKYAVNNAKYEIHLACVGDSAENDRQNLSTILVEAGEGPSEHTLQPFIHNAYANGTIHRYCYWDRPGFAWSDNAPSPHSAGMSADILSEALALAGEQGPWILVSAGVGSIYSRIFASRHVHDVTGLLLIDPTHEDQLQKIASPGRGFRLWGRGIVSPLGLDRLAGAIFKGRTREDRVYGRVSYQGGRFIKAKLQENLAAESMTASEIASAKNIQTPETPLVIVSSGVEVGRSESWAKQQEALTKITEHLVAWDIVKGAPHEVWETLKGREAVEKRLGELVRQ